jgi:hypothetical protein
MRVFSEFYYACRLLYVLGFFLSGCVCLPVRGDLRHHFCDKQLLLFAFTTQTVSENSELFQKSSSGFSNRRFIPGQPARKRKVRNGGI